jgi:NADPH:quinone reductase-like Zn-dependent oxidoreductase
MLRRVREWRLSDAFGIDRLRLEELPDPPLGPRDVRVRVRAASLNYRDVAAVERGISPRGVRLPLVPCSDAAGEVVETGPAVSRVQVGDRVAPIFFRRWLDGDTLPPVAYGSVLDGALADHMTLHEEGLVHLPPHLGDEEASTLGCAAVTAWHALVAKGRVRAGETILVQGTGGVSIFALQFALTAGARVIATSSSDEKLDRVRALGARETINYVTTPDWAERVLELTDGIGVDHVVEVGGLGTMEQSFRATRTGGRVSLIGVLTGFETKVDPHPAMLKGLSIQGIVVGSRAMYEEMNRAITVNELRPVVDRVFPFEEAREAFRHLESGAHVGKVVVSVEKRRRCQTEVWHSAAA